MSYKGGKVNADGEQEKVWTRTGYHCKASGCPNTGAIDGFHGSDNSGLCYWHWLEPDPRQWPLVTRMILHDEAMSNLPKEPIRVDVGAKGQDPRGWAYALKRREESGEKLTQFQKQSWREVVQ